MAYESNKLHNVNILSYYNNFMGGGNTSEIAMSKYQIIQPNRIVVRFNIKL